MDSGPNIHAPRAPVSGFPLPPSQPPPAPHIPSDDARPKARQVKGEKEKEKEQGPVPLSMPAILVNPRLKHLGPTSSSSKATSDAGRASASRTKGSTKRREVGKRKLRRSENARLASNPHVVRPSARDYQIGHPNLLRPMQALPTRLLLGSSKGSRAGLSGPPPIGSSSKGDEARQSRINEMDARSGQFSMSLKEAGWFLRHRIGVELAGTGSTERVTKDQVQGGAGTGTETETGEEVVTKSKKQKGQWQRPAGSREEEGEETKANLAEPARFILCADAHLTSWLRQDVYDLSLPSTSTASGAAVPSDTSSPLKTLFPSPTSSSSSSAYDESDVTSSLREKSRAPHSLCWIVEDPFLRLALHCLARIRGCPSFSKDEPTSGSSLPPAFSSDSVSAGRPNQAGTAGASAVQGTETEQLPKIRATWILHPRPMARPRGARGNLAMSPSGVEEVVGGRGTLETPPTTDVGTDVGTASEAEETDEVESVEETESLGEEGTDEESAGEMSGKGLRSLEEVDEWEGEEDGEVGDVTLVPPSSTAGQDLSDSVASLMSDSENVGWEADHEVTTDEDDEVDDEDEEEEDDEASEVGHGR